jgi:fructan beta-fructosidase
MAVYDEADGKQWIAFHTSPDLKKWTYQSRIEGFFECPDLFELPVDGKADNKKWVLYAADGQYVLGDFDGKEFKKESGKHVLWHGNYYAAQTFSDAPDGRRIQIGWGRGITFPGMPFNQQMTVPVEMRLHSTADGVRMFAEPVWELVKLRGTMHTMNDLKLSDSEQDLKRLTAELLDIEAKIQLGSCRTCELVLHGVPIIYDRDKEQLDCNGIVATLPLVDDAIHLRILVDRGSIEVFGNRGQMAMSVGVVPREESRGVKATTKGGEAVLHLTAYELKTAWILPGRKLGP